MSHRPRRKRKFSVSPREQRRALFLILSIVCIPLLGTVAVVISSSEQDLSDLAPLKKSAGDYLVLDWPALRRDHPHAMVSGTGLAAVNGAAVQALGYMADGARPIARGDHVADFVLLPEAGNLLHPAHRSGDQMIAVHLRQGDLSRFSPMGLVWVWGTLRMSPGDPHGLKPLYALEQARSQAADQTEIGKYFALR